MPEKQFFGKILVPVDDSTSSLAAEELTALIAKKFGSKVTAFHVVAHELMNPAMRDFLPGGGGHRYSFGWHYEGRLYDSDTDA
jgi:nucleotide-binding universal stress UspA family protein